MRPRTASGSISGGPPLPIVGRVVGGGGRVRDASARRDLLDLRTPQGVTLDEAARLLDAHPTHLVRVFTREHGMPPHLYLTGRRVDLARRLLLDGRPPAEVATAAGFYDQSHLTRHFKRMLGTSPAAFASTRRRKPQRPG